MNLRTTLAALAAVAATSTFAAGTPAKPAAAPAPAAVTAAVPAVSPERCNAYQAAITRDLKEASFHRQMGEGAMDNSVPRLTLSAIKYQGALSLIAMNLQSMLSAGCTAPAALDPLAYSGAAGACASSLKMTGNADSVFCDRSKW